MTWCLQFVSSCILCYYIKQENLEPCVYLLHLQKQKVNPEQEEASQVPYNQVIRQYPQTQPLANKSGKKKQLLSKDVLAGVSTILFHLLLVYVSDIRYLKVKVCTIQVFGLGAT